LQTLTGHFVEGPTIDPSYPFRGLLFSNSDHGNRELSKGNKVLKPETGPLDLDLRQVPPIWGMPEGVCEASSLERIEEQPDSGVATTFIP
jgi:hypothetical protein